MPKSLSLVVAACTGLAACAAPAQRPVPGDRWHGETDVIKIETVDRWALDHGATVVWIKYPQKHQGGNGD